MKKTELSPKQRLYLAAVDMKTVLNKLKLQSLSLGNIDLGQRTFASIDTWHHVRLDNALRVYIGVHKLGSPLGNDAKTYHYELTVVPGDSFDLVLDGKQQADVDDDTLTLVVTIINAAVQYECSSYNIKLQDGTLSKRDGGQNDNNR